MPIETPRFEPFTLTHLVSVLVCFAVIAVLALAGRAARGKPRATWMRLGLAGFGLAYWVGANAWYNWPSNFSLERSLPIQVCDLAGVIAPLAILTRYRPLRALLYFWGLGLSTQGFVTPVIQEGPGEVEFWLFWTTHTLIVGSAVYDLAALDFRPTWRDARFAILAIIGYLAVILPFDVALGLNYGYVGNVTTSRPTVMDALGPWPWRFAPLAGVVISLMLIMTAPWEWGRARAERAVKDTEVPPGSAAV